MIWSSNNKWGSKLRQKQAPQNRSTPRLLPPTWASAAESPGPKHQGQESPQGSPSLPLGLPKGPEHGATARQWPCEPSAPQRVNLQVCLLGVLCCVCGVLGLPAPVHRCARSVCCVACAVSWASRLLFTGVPARCVVLLCGASLRGAHSSIRTAAIVAGRGWVPSGRTHVHPDGGCS